MAFSLVESDSVAYVMHIGSTTNATASITRGSFHLAVSDWKATIAHERIRIDIATTEILEGDVWSH
jgi:hypothetical protein